MSGGLPVSFGPLREDENAIITEINYVVAGPDTVRKVRIRIDRGVLVALGAAAIKNRTGKAKLGPARAEVVGLGPADFTVYEPKGGERLRALRARGRCWCGVEHP